MINLRLECAVLKNSLNKSDVHEISQRPQEVIWCNLNQMVH